MFAYISIAGDERRRNRSAIAASKKPASPSSVSCSMISTIIGQTFFQWEIATAVAGSVIGINAFNQPDVEASKIVTRELTTEFEKTGSLPAEKPILDQDGIKLFTDKANAAL